MKDSLSNRLKRKRFRAVLVAMAALACLVFTGLNIDFEQADYTKSLRAEVDNALSILEQAQANQGNANGQYAPYTILEYQTAVGQARMVAENSESTYTQKQTAYETLKEQTATFQKAQNADSFSAQQLLQAAEAEETLSFSSDWGDLSSPTLLLTPSKTNTALDTNPVVVQDAPFTSLVSSTCEKYGLTGIPFTLLQDGDFCCDAVLELPLPDGQNAGNLYYYNRQNNGLELVSSSLSAAQTGVVSIPLSKGGDYFFAFSQNSTETITDPDDVASDSSSSITPSGTVTTSPNSTSSESVSSAQPTQTPPPAESTPSSTPSSSSGIVTPTPAPSALPVEPTPTAAPAQELTVSLEIRCDPLANDPSKLTDPAKKDYVPADGTILAKTEYKMPVGSTMFDLLTQVCKNNNIHIEYSFYSAFQSYYIEGINHLYEFDGGQLSGWLYRVNGVFPGYGCSAYTLADGDSVTLLYTCNGGEDVGNNWNG